MKLTEYLKVNTKQREDVMVITLDRMQYLEKNTALVSNLLPDIGGRIYLVVSNTELSEEDGSVVEADIDLDKSLQMKEISELNLKVLNLKQQLLAGV